MRLLALTRYGTLGPSTRVRFSQFEPSLARRGLQMDIVPLLSDEHVRRMYVGLPRRRGAISAAYLRRAARVLGSRRHDVVWVEKELLPYVPSWVERFLFGGQPYVLDYDDATFHTYDLHSSRIVRAALGDKIDRLMKGAALVVAGNAYLADRARAAGARRVEVVPSVVDVDRYGPVAPEADGPFTIGWIGSPGSERILEGFRPVFEAALSDSCSRLVLVGASDRVLRGIPHETWPWSDATEAEALRAFHVGIMPLEDRPWERGKCGFKLIQCMSAGRPVVASPVGVNAEIVSDGVTGLLASDTAAWTAALSCLRDDGGLRTRMGMAGRARAESTYSVAAVAPRIAELLVSAASPARSGSAT